MTTEPASARLRGTDVPAAGVVDEDVEAAEALQRDREAESGPTARDERHPPPRMSSANVAEPGTAAECLGATRSGNVAAMATPGVHIETLHDPARYTPVQIEKACALAAMLNRGKRVLVEAPLRRLS